jgi:hypothetical protein
LILKQPAIDRVRCRDERRRERREICSRHVEAGVCRLERLDGSVERGLGRVAGTDEREVLIAVVDGRSGVVGARIVIGATAAAVVAVLGAVVGTAAFGFELPPHAASSTSAPTTSRPTCDLRIPIAPG